LIAGSIINEGLIGVQFSPSFIKSLYDEEIKFDDLQDIFDPQTFNNYKLMKEVTRIEKYVKVIDVRR
jgi:Ubiquitin-protein ligase